MRTHIRLSCAFLAIVCICGCASEDQRYQENKAGAHLSPRAKASLSGKDLEEIARLIAHSTRKRIIAISAASKRVHPNAWDVTIGYPWGDRPDQFGFCYVTRDHGKWRVLQWFDGLSVSLVGLGFDDPTD
jgi:hypothetical protein